MTAHSFPAIFSKSTLTISTRVRLLPVREQEGCRLPGREDSLWFSFPTMNEDVTCCCHGQIVSLWSLSGISDNLCFNRRKYSHHFVTCASPREAWVLSSWLFPTLWDPMDHSLPGSSVHGVGGHFLLQGILLTQGSNPCLLCLWHWQVGSLPLAPPWKPLLKKNC